MLSASIGKVLCLTKGWIRSMGPEANGGDDTKVSELSGSREPKLANFRHLA